MGMLLLEDAQQWEAYKAQFAKKNEVELNQMQWGDGPGGFPCIVASIMKNPTTVVSCYIFPDDARMLCESAGYFVSPADDKSVAPRHDPDPPGRVSAEQDDFNRSTVAHLCSIVKFMTRTGIATEKTYQDEYTRQLHDVGQWSADERNKKLGKLAKEMTATKDDTGIGDPDAG